MEAYESARLEVITFDEDVITASVTGCEPYYRAGVNSTAADGWTVYYDDGSTANYSGGAKPEVCP